MDIYTLIKTLTDPENQPHQYVDKEEELIKDLFLGNEIKQIPVNNLLHGYDLKNEMCRDYDFYHVGDHGNIMVYIKERSNAETK